ncbi:MAG: MFS transporter [Phototrophicaceae bacterium]
MPSVERSKTVVAVYLSGMLVGISLILFPSAGSLFTDANFHHLNSAQFGVLFTPQIVTAIASSVLTASVARYTSMKRVLQIGLIFSALAMLLLVISNFTFGSVWVFPLLLMATGAMGAGFGFTISALNAYAFDLFPTASDTAVTAIHVMTGIGQIGASVLLSGFLGMGVWWGAPLTIALTIALMIVFQSPLPLGLQAEHATSQPDASSTQRDGRNLPLRVWLFALVTFTYGAIEGTFGNWIPIYLEQSANLTSIEAALGLSLFWTAVTTGRVLFAIAAVRLNVKPLFFITPFVVGAVFMLLPFLNGTFAHYMALFGVGLAISYFFPYSVSLASTEFPWLAATVSGLLVAGLQLGNGVSANIVGIASQSIGLATIFQSSTVYAVGMAVVVLYLGGTRSQVNSRGE